MPCFRGIDLSIVASDNIVFPEFPHPDGSSAKFRSLKAIKHKSAVFLSPKPWGAVDANVADNTQTADPKISVYIPSAPDTNFFFRYNVSHPPIGHKYLLFKLFINGRHAVSWGSNLREATSGVACQALFEPSSRFQYNDSGIIISKPGIESRCFRFVSNGGNSASVADDGGVIEVQVFRARARNRRAPQPDQYRGGDRYGIALVTNGLLDKPYLAGYHDYHLVDAKDAPYATFLFHYRSWENLRLLQIAPPEKPEFLCSTPLKRSASKATIAGSASSPSLNATPLKASPRRLFPWRRGRKQRTENPRLNHIGEPSEENTNPAFDPDDWSESTRLLADETVECSNAEKYFVQRGRGTSISSKYSATSKLSVTPSLQAYADGEDGTMVDTMEIGSATRIEAVFHGKMPDARLSGDRQEKPLLAIKDGIPQHRPSCLSQKSCDLDQSFPSSTWEPLSTAFLMPPFTDSLRKRDATPAKPATSPHSVQHQRANSHDCSCFQVPHLWEPQKAVSPDPEWVSQMERNNWSPRPHQKRRGKSNGDLLERKRALEDWLESCSRETEVDGAPLL